MNSFLRNTVFLLFLYSVQFYSQTREQSLITTLTQIEKKYQISFSYKDETLKNIKIDFQYEEKEPLENLLQRLGRLTDLNFNLLNDRFVTINMNKNHRQASFFNQELEEVHISNYLTSGIAKNTTGGITITPKKTGILPGLIEPDILQTIQALPGVLSVNEDVSNISVRGGTPDQNHILYDGIKMYQTGHFFGLISAFNPNLVKKVSVYQHGTQAVYGDGVSSVINMELSDSKEETLKVGMGVNLISADGFAIVPLGKKTAIQVAARRSITDVGKTPTYEQYFDRIFQDSDLTNLEDAAVSKNENFYFYDAALKFLYDISDKDNLRINFLSIYNSLDYEEETITRIINNSSKSELKQQSLVFGLNYKRQWNTQLNTNILIYHSAYSLNGINFNIIQNQRLVQENNVFDNSVKLNVTNRFNEKFDLHGGIQLSQVLIHNLEDLNNPQFKRSSKQVIRKQASYLEGEYRSSSKNSTGRFGLRHSYLEKFDVHLIEPRLYVSQRLSKYFRIDFSAEFKNQTISQVIDLQNDFLGIEKRRWVIADNALIPIIKSKQATFGLANKQNDLLFRIEAFVKKVSGITTRSQGFQNQYQFVYRIGDYKIKGIDFLINKQFSNFRTWLSYSLSKNDYDFEMLNDNMVFPSNFDINHTINFSTTYDISNLKLALGMNWHSAKPNTRPQNTLPVIRNTINYQSPNSKRLPDYLRMDFSSTYELKLRKSKIQIGVSIWNILNKKNIINTYYQVNDQHISQIDNSALSITPNLSLRYWF